jgi:hypothetical protein
MSAVSIETIEKLINREHGVHIGADGTLTVEHRDYAGVARENARLSGELTAMRAECDRLSALINNAETDDFLRGVRLEAAHQIEKWGEAQKREKSAEAWYWLIAYLAGKALRAAMTGERTKAQHHTISSAAALLHWHISISQDVSECGYGPDHDLARFDAAAPTATGTEDKS